MRAIVIAAMLVTAPAAAHRGHDAMTVIAIDAKGGMTVSHRFEAHDLEPALATIAPAAQASLDDPEAVRALVAYLAARFVVMADNRRIALTPGAVDVGSDQVRIAFAGRTKLPLRRLTLSSSILADVYPRQINQILVRYQGRTQSIALGSGATRSLAMTR